MTGTLETGITVKANSDEQQDVYKRQGRSIAGMLLFNESVIYTAHLQKTATETFEEMRDFFEGAKRLRHVAEIKTALGREQIILKSGARIKFLARTRTGGRGQHGDLLIFDEAQALSLIHIKMCIRDRYQFVGIKQVRK